MSQLHELLAAEPDVKAQVAKVHSETLAILGKPDYFSGHTSSLKMTKSGMDEITKTAVEQAGREEKMVTTTVDERLAYDASFFIRRVDHSLQKDKTNQIAKADVIVGGTTIAKDLPATFLLSLEQLLIEKRKQYATAPTLSSGTNWILDDRNAKKGVYKSPEPDRVLKTEKDFTFKILTPSTDKHPAQIEKWNVDVPVGITEKVKYLGMWTSARKAEVLARIDMLIVAVKEARARANQAEIQTGNVGADLVRFIEAVTVNT